MKWRNSYAVVAGCTAASLMALDAQERRLTVIGQQETVNPPHTLL
jgi:hypothetical protein